VEVLLQILEAFWISFDWYWKRRDQAGYLAYEENINLGQTRFEKEGRVLS